MILSAIAAMSLNRVIGVNNTLPWNIPQDLKFFKTKTAGHILIMGRKTFDSIGRPLPGRLHIVITRQKDWKFDHPLVIAAQSLEAAIQIAKSKSSDFPGECFIAGGGDVYRQSIPLLNKIYLTVIEKNFEGDAFFPEFDENAFHLVESEKHNGDIPFSFRTYAREI